MSGRRLRNLMVSVLVILLLVYAFYRLAVWAGLGGTTAPLYSSVRYDPYGTAALEELLRESGYKTVRLQHRRIHEYSDAVLIQVLPRGGPNGPPLPVNRLLNWMRKGNTIVQLTRSQTQLMQQLGIPSSGPAVPMQPTLFNPRLGSNEVGDQAEREQLRGKFPHTLSQPTNAQQMDGNAQAPLKLRLPESYGTGPQEWEVLATDNANRTVAGRLPVGDGQLIVVGAPTVATNEGLPLGGNLDFMLSQINHRTVLFDEWSHGMGHTGSVMQLLKRFGLVPVLLQAMVVMLLYTWSGWSRVWRDRDRSRRRRSSVEQIEVLGHLYGRTLSRTEAFKRVHEEVVMRLCRALRCQRDTLNKRIAELPEEKAEKVKKFAKYLQDLKAVPAKRVSDGNLVDLLTSSHQLVMEIKGD